MTRATPSTTLITTAEHHVMETVWAWHETAEHPGMKAADIIAALNEPHDWSAKTVRSMLSRLVTKGALATTAKGRFYLYHPLISREDHQRGAVRGLAARLFKGRAAPLLSFLAEGDGLSDTDIAEIEALIETLKS